MTSLDIPASWTFKSEDVAAGFDAHVREQLPWYDLATGIVAQLARHFIPPGGIVVDVGASTGNIGRAIEPTLLSRGARLIAIDEAEAMQGKYAGPGDFLLADARSYDFAKTRPDLIIAFLALMFVPVADRAALLGRMRSAVRPGGAVVVFDKREPIGGEIGQIIYRLTLAAKYEAGAKPEEIIAKELSLAGVQRPMAKEELVGFVEVFRFGDFGGWIYTAPKGM